MQNDIDIFPWHVAVIFRRTSTTRLPGQPGEALRWPFGCLMLLNGLASYRDFTK